MPDPLIVLLERFVVAYVDGTLVLLPNGENPALAFPGLPEKGDRPFSSSTRFFKSSIPNPLEDGGV